MADDWILGDEAGWQGEDVFAVSGCRLELRWRVRWLSECQQTRARWCVQPRFCDPVIWSGVAFIDSGLHLAKNHKNRRRIFHLRKHTDLNRELKACFGFCLFFSAVWSLKCWSSTNPPSLLLCIFFKLQYFFSGSVFRIFTVKPEIELNHRK